MGIQLDIFQETKKSRYKAFYDDFYKGVAERYERERIAKQTAKYERISIRIKPVQDDTSRPH